MNDDDFTAEEWFLGFLEEHSLVRPGVGLHTDKIFNKFRIHPQINY